MASGDTLLILTPKAAVAPATAYATLDVVAATTATPDINRLVLDFNETEDEYADWLVMMPRHYGSGGSPTGITLTFVWTCEPIINDVSWAAQIRSEGSTDAHITKNFSTAVVATAATAPGTARNIAYTTLALTDGAQMDSVAAGEMMTVRVYRDISVATTIIGDVELHLIEVRET